MEATAIVPVGSLTWLLVVARMIHFCVYISYPSCTSGGLDNVSGIMIPLDGGYGNHLSQVLGVVAGGGEAMAIVSVVS